MNGVTNLFALLESGRTIIGISILIQFGFLIGLVRTAEQNYLYKSVENVYENKFNLSFALLVRNIGTVFYFSFNNGSDMFSMSLTGQKLMVLNYNGREETIKLFENPQEDRNISVNIKCSKEQLSFTLQSKPQAQRTFFRSESNALIDKYPFPGNCTSNRTIAFWIGNVGPFKDCRNKLFYPIISQLRACLNSFTFNDDLIQFERKMSAKYIQSHCENPCKMNVCSNGECSSDLNSFEGYRCDCVKSLYNGIYCNKTLRNKMENRVFQSKIREETDRKFVSIKLSWIQEKNDSYRLLSVTSKQFSVIYYVSKIGDVELHHMSSTGSGKVVVCRNVYMSSGHILYVNLTSDSIETGCNRSLHKHGWKPSTLSSELNVSIDAVPDEDYCVENGLFSGQIDAVYKTNPSVVSWNDMIFTEVERKVNDKLQKENCYRDSESPSIFNVYIIPAVVIPVLLVIVATTVLLCWRRSIKQKYINIVRATSRPDNLPLKNYPSRNLDAVSSNDCRERTTSVCNYTDGMQRNFRKPYVAKSVENQSNRLYNYNSVSTNQLKESIDSMFQRVEEESPLDAN